MWCNLLAVLGFHAGVFDLEFSSSFVLFLALIARLLCVVSVDPALSALHCSSQVSVPRCVLHILG